MRLFGKRETLNMRLAREGGMSLDGDDGDTARPAWDASGIHGLQRARQWDTVTTIEAPGIAADRVDFVALGPGALVVEGDARGVEALAHSVDRELAAPYRAEAVRRDGDLWAVAARKIELVELPGVEGQEIELSLHRDEKTLRVDGETVFGSIPALERPEHVVRARRVSGETWEIEVHPL